MFFYDVETKNGRQTTSCKSHEVQTITILCVPRAKSFGDRWEACETTCSKEKGERRNDGRSLPVATGNGMHHRIPMPTMRIDDADSERVTNKAGQRWRRHRRISSSALRRAAPVGSGSEASWWVIQQPRQCHCHGQKRNAWTKFNTRLAKRLEDNNVSTSWVHSCRCVQIWSG